jgi:hypothetical protein
MKVNNKYSKYWFYLTWHVIVPPQKSFSCNQYSFSAFNLVQSPENHQKFLASFAWNCKTSLGQTSCPEFYFPSYFNCPCLKHMDEPGTSSGVTRNETARGKNCVIPPPTFIWRSNLLQLSRTLFNFFFPFFVFRNSLNTFKGILDVSDIAIDTRINVTRDAHALRLTTGRMQFGPYSFLEFMV